MLEPKSTPCIRENHPTISYEPRLTFTRMSNIDPHNIESEMEGLLGQRFLQAAFCIYWVSQQVKIMRHYIIKLTGKAWLMMVCTNTCRHAIIDGSLQQRKVAYDSRVQSFPVIGYPLLCPVKCEKLTANSGLYISSISFRFPSYLIDPPPPQPLITKPSRLSPTNACPVLPKVCLPSSHTPPVHLPS